MPEQDAGAGQLEHAEKVLDMVLPAGDQATRVMEPGKEPFDFPTTPGSSQWAAVLRRDVAASAVLGDHLDPVVLPEPGVERIAVVAAIADQSRRELADEA